MDGNHPLELNRAVPGGRVEMFAISDDEYPGGWFYRFQYYHPEEGEILRFDNAHDDDDLGWHHRHVSFGKDNEITFQSITAHVARFLQEVAHLTHTEDTNND
ncbi:hypothetical protein B4589_015990 (plasmid) [Halolamina sp. CBA1230]|uniref:toxin-antitoxin system TumE family protein n=1 Tax=Halolamina sp. CBA1230 TaxID=1853690 RepID=UPI0009A1644E|nr:DUF6516 family protein [Halolamina sp. CBA1230]QKY21913.1 hypothetical protein B4589_015990 [Halolamina sp. CBA1230]